MVGDSVRKAETPVVEELEEANKFLRGGSARMADAVIEEDPEAINQGKLLESATDSGLSSFMADMLSSQITSNFSMAEKLYGATFIKELTQYNPDFLEKNMALPEFRRQLKREIAETVEKLKKHKLITSEGDITEDGLELAGAVLLLEELERQKSGFEGTSKRKEKGVGEREEIHPYRKEPYRDISIRATIRKAIKRGHSELEPSDLQISKRHALGSHHIIYAIDSSGSMKGDKLKFCKKAGVALAYAAIKDKNEVGVMVFGKDVKIRIPPTLDFTRILSAFAGIRAKDETDLAHTISESIGMFPKEGSKHLLLLTDAMPTVGKSPERNTLEAAYLAKKNGITISVIGIRLDLAGRALAEKIVDAGAGRLYLVKEIENLSEIVLEDYSHESSA